jgi:hypothetical protein
MSRLQTLVNAPDGRVLGVNLKRLAEIPYFLLTNSPANEIVVPANQSSPQAVLSVSGEGPAQILAFSRQVLRGGVLQADAQLRVNLQIQDGQTQRGLMNGAVHVDTITGNQAGQAYRLAEALYLDELRSLIVSFTDFSAVANSIRLCSHAQKFLSQRVDSDLSVIRARLDRRQYLSMPYWYTLDAGPVTLAPGAAAQFPITVGQDHHFQIFKLSAVIVDALGAFNQPWTVDIVDISKGESIINGPQSSNFQINGNLVFGSGNFPVNLHQPWLVQAGMQLVVSITNTHAQAQTFHLTLGGRALADRMWR